jgi:hypothetical protein
LTDQIPCQTEDLQLLDPSRPTRFQSAVNEVFAVGSVVESQRSAIDFMEERPHRLTDFLSEHNHRTPTHLVFDHGITSSVLWTHRSRTINFYVQYQVTRS